MSLFIKRSVDIGRAEPVESKQADAYDGTDKPTTGFKILSVVGFVDSAIRAAALTFVPFILKDRGMEITEIFIMFILLMAGGAFGKYICGWFSERHGLISIVWVTKASAAVFLVATIYAPMPAMAPLMVLLGIGLNGTSSSLYATVAVFAPQAPPLPDVWVFLHHQRNWSICRSARIWRTRGYIQPPSQYASPGAVHGYHSTHQPALTWVPESVAGIGGCLNVPSTSLGGNRLSPAV